jgi:hypothetical protein
MRYYGGVVVALYAAANAFGWRLFDTDDERGEVPAQVRSSPTGLLGWTGGYMGGK